MSGEEKRGTKGRGWCVWLGAIALLGAYGVVPLLPTPSAGGGGQTGWYEDTRASGVASADGTTSFFALPDGGRTQLLRIDRHDGEQRLRRLRIDGDLMVPAVAVDGTTGGLSSDGGTLVLVERAPVIGRGQTRMTLIDTSDELKLKVSGRIRLKGDYSFDAISPDGSNLYLTHHTDSRDRRVYEVVSYDVGTGAMSEVLDSSVAEITMRGFPQTRATGHDGRWEYTLYDGSLELPFVHALDTVEGTAVCVGLDHLAGKNVAGASIEVGPSGVLSIANRRERPLAEIDASDWRVSDPRSTAAVGSPRDAAGAFTRADWAVGAALLAGLGGLFGFWRATMDR